MKHLVESIYESMVDLNISNEALNKALEDIKMQSSSVLSYFGPKVQVIGERLNSVTPLLNQSKIKSDAKKYGYDKAKDILIFGNISKWDKGGAPDIWKQFAFIILTQLDKNCSWKDLVVLMQDYINMDKYVAEPGYEPIHPVVRKCDYSGKDLEDPAFVGYDNYKLDDFILGNSLEFGEIKIYLGHGVYPTVLNMKHVRK